MAFLIQKQNPLSPGFGPDDQLLLTRSWGHWHLHRRRWLAWNTSNKPSLGAYELDLWAINTHKALVDAIFYLGGKPDAQHSSQALRDIFRDAAYSDSFNGKELATTYWKESIQTPPGQRNFPLLFQAIHTTALRSAVDLLSGCVSPVYADQILGDYRHGGARHPIAVSLYNLIDAIEQGRATYTDRL